MAPATAARAGPAQVSPTRRIRGRVIRPGTSTIAAGRDLIIIMQSIPTGIGITTVA